jgi:hypothetical protein
MKTFLLTLAIVFLTACSGIHTIAGPKPDVKPVMVSNQATIQDIGATRTALKNSQENFKSGFVGLKAVDQYLALLLHTPPKDHGPLILKAQEQLHAGMSQLMQAAAELAEADQRAASAEQHARATDGYAKVLESRVDEAYIRELALAKDNVKIKPIYEQCTKWWGLGAVLYGFGQLAKHLLILAAVLIVVAAAGLLGYALFTSTPVGVAFSLVTAPIVGIFNRLHK